MRRLSEYSPEDQERITGIGPSQRRPEIAQPVVQEIYKLMSLWIAKQFETTIDKYIAALEKKYGTDK